MASSAKSAAVNASVNTPVDAPANAPVTVRSAVRATDLPAKTQVFIAGGGPVGLATAVELGRRGIRCVVAEPRVVVSHARPRCKTINVRSMHHMRRWQLADRLRALAPLPTDWTQDVVFCTSLAGRELSRFTGVLGLVHEGDRFPELGQQVPQYVLEELLRDAVDELGTCTFAPGVTVTGLEQDDDGARVTVTDAAGATSTIAAEYVIGCDGPRSTVRELIGSSYSGDHALRPNFGMVFRAPGLWEHVGHGPAVHYWIINSVAPALAGPLDQTDMWWIIAFGVDRETGEREGQRLIDAAAGVAAGATVESTDSWTARMQIVDRMHRGRVFLAGDAAHLNPPFGGHGLNTGLGDAVDLGWKLAAVLDGWGGSSLLDSYEVERRPIQEQVIAEAAANLAVTSAELLADNLDEDDEAGEQARHAAGVRIQEVKRQEFHSLELVLGIEISNSPVIVPGEGAEACGAAAERGSGSGNASEIRVGALLPHRWLADGRSLYDALGEGMTLLVLSGGASASAAGLRAEISAWKAAADARSVPLTVAELEENRAERELAGPTLVLVRPDQYVAWAGEAASADVADLLDRIRGASGDHSGPASAPVPAVAIGG